MKWYTTEPPRDTAILCKFKAKQFGLHDTAVYYVVVRDSILEKEDNRIHLRDALRGVYEWKITDLIAWTTFEELDDDLDFNPPLMRFTMTFDFDSSEAALEKLISNHGDIREFFNDSATRISNNRIIGYSEDYKNGNFSIDDYTNNSEIMEFRNDD